MVKTLTYEAVITAQIGNKKRIGGDEEQGLIDIVGRSEKNCSQSVKRAVKLVNPTSKSVLGFERYGGYTKTGVNTCAAIPTVSTNTDITLSTK